jgi:hypothetical protein
MVMGVDQRLSGRLATRASSSKAGAVKVRTVRLVLAGMSGLEDEAMPAAVENATVERGGQIASRARITHTLGSREQHQCRTYQPAAAVDGETGKMQRRAARQTRLR